MSLQADYDRIREGAATGATSERRQLAVSGRDRASYLQGLLTNDIQALTPGTGCYAAWLTPQGRMLTDMHVLESGAMILLDVPAETAAATLARLEQFVFTEDVRIESCADSLRGVWVHGPHAAGAIDRALEGAPGLAEWPDYRHAPFSFAGEPVSVARIDQLGVPGFCVFVARAREAALVEALAAAGAAPAGPGAIAAARIEAGYPVFGADMTDDTIPLEAGIEDRAISFSKGCYVGQEVIIRVLHRGHGRVARRLVRLRIAGPPVSRGTALYAGDREVGHVTSAGDSPRSGAVAMGYLHRDFAAPGTRVEAAAPGGRVAAVVSDTLVGPAG
jgi:folate-binding protein YgfZ